jgi:hypothetical protein
MKIKIYNKTNSQLVREGQATVRMNTKTGMISFSKAACANIGLEDKSKVIFIQDEESPKDWFVATTKLEDGMICKGRVRKDDHFEAITVQSTHVCREIAESCKIKVISFSFLVAKVSTELLNMRLFAILTASLNTITRNTKKDVAKN